MTEPTNSPHADGADDAEPPGGARARSGAGAARPEPDATARSGAGAAARIDRRRLLAGTAAAAALGGIGAGRPWRRFVAFVDAPLEQRLVAIGPWSPSVRAVGEAYLRARPADGDATTLVALLRADLGLPAGAAVDRDLRQTARQAILRDFTDRRTMRLDGWVASPTEARLAALAVVSRPGPGRA
jgi:hypothetical protein